MEVSEGAVCAGTLTSVLKVQISARPRLAAKYSLLIQPLPHFRFFFAPPTNMSSGERLRIFTESTNHYMRQVPPDWLIHTPSSRPPPSYPFGPEVER